MSEMERFQSHAGSIEAVAERFGEGHPLSFNPTLVRLRRNRPLVGLSTEPQFQSHAGSIEALKLGTPVKRPSSVSIPRWFD